MEDKEKHNIINEVFFLELGTSSIACKCIVAMIRSCALFRECFPIYLADGHHRGPPLIMVYNQHEPQICATVGD